MCCWMLLSASNWKWILLSFNQPTNLLKLFKMRSYLASFQIFPTRVFHKIKISSLFGSVWPRFHNYFKILPDAIKLACFPHLALKKQEYDNQSISLKRCVRSAEAGLISAFAFLEKLGKTGNLKKTLLVTCYSWATYWHNLWDQYLLCPLEQQTPSWCLRQ